MSDFTIGAASAPGWRLIPISDEHWGVEHYIAEDGECIATVEGMGEEMPSYPHAFDPIRKEWIRGGAMQDLPSAKAWAERVVGLRPRMPGDVHEGDGSHPIAGLDPATRFR